MRRAEDAGLHDGGNQAAVRTALHPRFGVASSILAALEAHAYGMGVTSITAEAGSAQPDGRNFYQSCGFDEVPNFGPYIGVEHSYCYAKKIDSHSAAHTAMA